MSSNSTACFHISIAFHNNPLAASTTPSLPSSIWINHSTAFTKPLNVVPSLSPPEIVSDAVIELEPPKEKETESHPPTLGIKTADLFVPSQSPLLSPASSKNRSTALDFRYGPIVVDWMDSTGSSNNRREMLSSGSTPLGSGIIHLYKELGVATNEEKGTEEKEEDGRVVGVVSVPGNIEVTHFLRFIEPALEKVEQLRMIRDSTPNRTIVLIKFKEVKDAREFTVIYNGKAYYEKMKDVRSELASSPSSDSASELTVMILLPQSEICQIVKISSIQLTASSSPPFAFTPANPTAATLPVATKEGYTVVELPSCPVCLERLDGNVSGLITVLCRHTFHCSCLMRWGDTRYDLPLFSPSVFILSAHDRPIHFEML
jgi:hypothetical protein